MYSTVNDIQNRFDRKEILDLGKRVDCYTWCYPLRLGDFNPLEVWKKNDSVPMNSKQATLYVHVPFCKFICSMCPFTHEPLKPQNLDLYVDSIIKEIELYSSNSLSKELEVSSIFFGGGTASVLSPKHIDSILKTMKSRFDILSDCDITVECHPMTVGKDYLASLKACGVNRVTFGVQSFNKENIDSLKLHQIPFKSIKVIKNALEVGFKTVAIDLMYNFPNQKIEGLAQDINMALDLGVHSISFYALDPEVRELNKVKDEQNSLETEKEMFNYIFDKMKETGFIQVAQPDYALPGHENKQIQDLWQSPQCQNLSFGAGAFSESFNGFTWANVHDADEYISMIQNRKFPVLMGKRWSYDDALSRYPALGVRCLNVDMKKFEDIFSIKFQDIYKYEIALLKSYDYIDIKDNMLIVTQKGKFFIDNISKCFFSFSNRGKTQLWGCNLRELRPKEVYDFGQVLNK
ncbi:hemin receptor [Clostridium botulinum]|uniref:Heme chaperone HemW n=1 Tax=Clostridium botulinum TaxID=1491 RepID=A0ABD7CFW4_CLOBO|nr:coproporphyrinogen-III oxidase family protein [Clostridium botulinum]KGO15603.1 hemin receptor [Clostridium botulinum]QRI52003.1 coproporphyrinogen III oxidase family protein [Clostridium botulinum]